MLKITMIVITMILTKLTSKLSDIWAKNGIFGLEFGSILEAPESGCQTEFRRFCYHFGVNSTSDTNRYGLASAVVPPI